MGVTAWLAKILIHARNASHLILWSVEFVYVTLLWDLLLGLDVSLIAHLAITLILLFWPATVANM